MEFQAAEGRFIMAVEDIQAAHCCGKDIQVWLYGRTDPFCLKHADDTVASIVYGKLLNTLGKP